MRFEVRTYDTHERIYRDEHRVGQHTQPQTSLVLNIFYYSALSSFRIQEFEYFYIRKFNTSFDFNCQCILNIR